MERYNGKVIERDGDVILDAVTFGVGGRLEDSGQNSIVCAFKVSTPNDALELVTRTNSDFVMLLDDGRMWRMVPGGVSPGSAVVSFRISSDLNR